MCVTAGSIQTFATDCDSQRVHLDDGYARGSFFGELVGSGGHVTAHTIELMVEARVLSATQIIAEEVDCIRFLEPLRAANCNKSAEANQNNA